MYTDIKSFEDACTALNITPAALPVVSALRTRHQKAIVVHYKLSIITEAINAGEGWEPDWDNSSQWKYYPWFDMRTKNNHVPGSGFSFNGFDYGRTHSFVGSRLCFPSEEIAEYVGETFADLYRDLMVLEK